MEKKQLQNILQKPFELSDWQNLLTAIFDVKRFHQRPAEIPLPNNDKAESAFELGSFNTEDDRIIGLYLVKAKPDVWLERNKVSLRELLRSVYKYDVDGAIIVFEQQEKWRLSFVSDIKVLNEEGEIVKQATEPKRYTYLLGEGEKVRTPADRLIKIAGKQLYLNDILNAFSVEALNEEFYKIVKTYFYQLVGGKIGKGNKTADFGGGILQLPSKVREVRQEFAVRLIGRTVFCWFLKMKKSDDEITLLPEALLSSVAVRQYKNYYHAILERLFFQTLNTPMDERLSNLPKDAGTIPFLNGGLFEPNTDDFYLPEKNGINAHKFGIDDSWFLAFFEELEKYNFTLDENSVTEIEVSVDPEMLGRIFENLLAEIDPDSGETARKATGSFYTPREIVDYMATESLVQYIHNQTQIEQDNLRPIFKMLEANDPIFTEVEKDNILKALDNVKILDPACGSGAFPMGVLQKIVQALQKLDPDAKWWKKRQIDRISNAIVKKQLREKLAASGVEYARKIGVIQNSLYGVDIQPIAAEISKLRCFLSLIVDENIDETKPNRGIEPLPNLEFKFVTADTLIKLPEEKQQRSMFDNFEELQQLEELRNEYIQSFGKAKQKVKEQFLKVQQKIAKDQSSLFADTSSKAYKIGHWNPFRHDKSDWFDLKWMFGVEKFDVVIGNPPYVQLQKEGGRLAKQYEKQGYTTFQRTGDIYTLFYESGVDILDKKGVLCFITSNKWMRAGYGESTRKFFAENTNPILLIDFAGQKIFDSATVDTNILLLSKDKNQQKTLACIVKEKVLNNLSVFVRQAGNVCAFANADSWVILSDIEQRIKEKIERVGTPLKNWDIQINYGIKTGFNDAFIIDGAKRKELIAQDSKSDEIIRPILRGRDIKRYGYDFEDRYLIATFPSLKIDIEKYPAVKKHLLSFGMERLEQTGKEYKKNGETIKARKKTANKWFETQDSISYWDDFSKQKIVWKRVGSILRFSYDEAGTMALDSTCFATGKYIKFLVAVLNSKMGHYLMKDAPQTGTGDLLISVQAIEPLKIPIPNSDTEKSIEKIIDKILKQQNETLEKELDQIIYELYKLNREEIRFIESQ